MGQRRGTQKRGSPGKNPLVLLLLVLLTAHTAAGLYTRVSNNLLSARRFFLWWTNDRSSSVAFVSRFGWDRFTQLHFMVLLLCFVCPFFFFFFFLFLVHTANYTAFFVRRYWSGECMQQSMQQRYHPHTTVVIERQLRGKNGKIQKNKKNTTKLKLKKKEPENCNTRTMTNAERSAVVCTCYKRYSTHSVSGIPRMHLTHNIKKKIRRSWESRRARGR